MGDRERLGHLLLDLEQIADAEYLVDHARAVPQNHLAASHFLQILAEMAVRGEQDAGLVPLHLLDGDDLRPAIPERGEVSADRGRL